MLPHASLVHMADLQIRSVDEALAREAKARAARSHLTLSDYVKNLIQQDLQSAAAIQEMRALLAEIQEDEQTLVPKSATASALADVRREMGTG